MHIGYHESTSNGLEGLGKEALKAGADTFAFFTRNPRGGSAKSVEKDDAEKLNPSLKELPFILETPNEFEGYRQEIELLKSKVR